MATSDVAICNLALQKLGASRITSLDEDSVNAREMNACYTAIRDAELRKHTWNFAVKRVSLPADSSGPTHGPDNSFTLPADFLRLLAPDPSVNVNTLDWRVEGRAIVTDDDAPLLVRYIYRVEDPNEFDALFIDALACRLAWQTCEKITQSNTKKADVRDEYKEIIREAKRANAIEQNTNDEPPADTWDTARH